MFETGAGQQVAKLLVGLMMMIMMMIWVYLNNNSFLHNEYRVFSRVVAGAWC
jgi:hypothetical protein